MLSSNDGFVDAIVFTVDVASRGLPNSFLMSGDGVDGGTNDW